MTEAPRLSVLLCVHNEEARLGRCLEHLRFAEELVVVLDRCTDGSRAIAEQFGARVIEGAFELEGLRRNTAIAAATGAWSLEIDADELVPPALAGESRAAIAAAGADAYPIRVDNYVGGHLIRHGWGAAFGTSQVTRLFRSGGKRWGDQRVHPRVTFSGTIGEPLATPLHHEVNQNISDMIRRLDRYTSARARDLRDQGYPGDFLGHNVARFFGRFYKCYVRRHGYREGLWGFLIALMAGLYPLLSYLKARLEPS